MEYLTIMLTTYRAPATVYAIAVTISAVLLISCKGSLAEDSTKRTYHMGEKVQVGPLIYNVLETEWKTQLEGSSQLPRNRILLVKLAITNSSGPGAIAVPLFTVESANGQSFPELSEGLNNLPGWLGLLRNLRPSETEQGNIVFDVPFGAYTLQVSDGGEIGQEKTAAIEIPVQIQ